MRLITRSQSTQNEVRPLCFRRFPLLWTGAARGCEHQKASVPKGVWWFAEDFEPRIAFLFPVCNILTKAGVCDECLLEMILWTVFDFWFRLWKLEIAEVAIFGVVTEIAFRNWCEFPGWISRNPTSAASYQTVASPSRDSQGSVRASCDTAAPRLETDPSRTSRRGSTSVTMSRCAPSFFSVLLNPSC